MKWEVSSRHYSRNALILMSHTSRSSPGMSSLTTTPSFAFKVFPFEWFLRVEIPGNRGRKGSIWCRMSRFGGPSLTGGVHEIESAGNLSASSGHLDDPALALAPGAGATEGGRPGRRRLR